MANRVFGIRLDPRQAWAWKRLGNRHIREWLAPESVCVECGSRAAQPMSRNGWFCYFCQDQLSQRELLPDQESQTLLRQNQDLRTEVNKLRTQLQERQQLKPKAAQQLTLFELDP